MRTTPTVKVVAAISVSMAAATTAVSKVEIVSMRAMLCRNRGRAHVKEGHAQTVVNVARDAEGDRHKKD
jgi:hypothetical protein